MQHNEINVYTLSDQMIPHLTGVSRVALTYKGIFKKPSFTKTNVIFLTVFSVLTF